MAKHIFLLSILLLSVFSASAETRKYKIGLSTTLTGDAATYGMDIRDSVLFAIEKYFPGRIELIVEDDQCDAKQAVSIAQKFANVDHVDAVIGPCCSGSVLSAAPVYEKARVPVMVTNASSAQISDAGDYIFRTFPSDSKLATMLATYIGAHYKSIAVISEQSGFAQSIKSGLLTSLPKSVEVSAEDYLPGTADFRSVTTRLLAKRPEAYFISAQTESSFAQVLSALRQLSDSIPVLGAYWPGSQSFLKLVGKQAEGIVFAESTSVDSVLNADGRLAYEEYKSKFSNMRSTDLVFATSVEGVKALVAALDSGDVRHELYTREFNGVFGPFRFDKDGEIQGLSFAMKKISGGQVVALKSTEY